MRSGSRPVVGKTSTSPPRKPAIVPSTVPARVSCTRVGPPPAEFGRIADAITASLEGSLARLRLDRYGRNELAAEPPEFTAQVREFCYDLVSHLVLDDGLLRDDAADRIEAIGARYQRGKRLAAQIAGIEVRAALVKAVRSFMDGAGLTPMGKLTKLRDLRRSVVDMLLVELVRRGGRTPHERARKARAPTAGRQRRWARRAGGRRRCRRA